MNSRGFLHALLSDLPVKVICLTAAVILFLFHRVNTMTERFFSVPLEVSTPPGLAIASPYPKTVRITLRGSEDAIYPILEEDIEATADLESHKSQGVFRAPVRISRRGTAANVEPLEIKVEPQDVAFTLEPLAGAKGECFAGSARVPRLRVRDGPVQRDAADHAGARRAKPGSDAYIVVNGGD